MILLYFNHLNLIRSASIFSGSESQKKSFWFLNPFNLSWHLQKKCWKTLKTEWWQGWEESYTHLCIIFINILHKNSPRCKCYCPRVRVPEYSAQKRSLWDASLLYVWKVLLSLSLCPIVFCRKTLLVRCVIVVHVKRGFLKTLPSSFPKTDVQNWTKWAIMKASRKEKFNKK